MSFEFKFAIIMSFITTFFVSIVIVFVNIGFNENFVFIWLRTWLIAFVLVACSILFLAPKIRKFLMLKN
jgi:hypothetical protein